MANEILWSDFATESLNDIFDYYKLKANRKVANKIKRQILHSTRQLLKNPESGQIEYYLKGQKQNYRYLVNGNYKIIYRIENDKIHINDVFDTRQNPTKILDEDRNKH